ncbi:MAG: hypothetical protein C0467_23220 [Planctomycetaceae bacterium]|nr:hypothetical protein [Planctomycetaceae bacterium]
MEARMSRKLSSLGLDMPDDFPVDAYDGVSAKIQPAREVTAQEAKMALMALAYRFLACSDHDSAFSKLVAEHGVAPPIQQRYEQERELFNFFVNGLSAIECLSYSLHAVAGIIDSTSFPLDTFKKKKAVSLELTVKRFEKRFPGDGLTQALHSLLDDKENERWEGIRNILTHRVTFGRAFSKNLSFPELDTACFHPVELKPKGEDKTELEVIVIDETTTRQRREWLSASITKVLVEAETFVTRNEELFRGSDAPLSLRLKPINIPFEADGAVSRLADKKIAIEQESDDTISANE